ncbi:MAG: hypothetical protein AAFP19_24095, partial [Bacteroidota bacterium]
MKRIVQLCAQHKRALAMPIFLLSFLCTITIGQAQTTLENRTATNTIHCTNAKEYGVWLKFDDLNNFYRIENGQFEEFNDGTAIFTADISNHDNNLIQFDIEVEFSGRTFNAPMNSPKSNNCYPANTDDWYYYTSTVGTLTGKASA